MSSAVFHPFALLPTELRLQIWEAACFESTPTSRGLQYINVRNGWAEPMPYTKGRSAYLIDRGVWKACKESRQVICQRSQFYDWLRIQRRAMDEYKYFTSYDPPGESGFNPDGRSGGDWPHPAIIDTFEGEEDRMLIRPGRDIFCIKMENWSRYFTPGIYLSFLQRPSTRHKYSLSLWAQTPEVKNVALEFDKSWLTDLPDRIYKLSDEASARGCFAYLYEQARWRTIRGTDLWIVDKEVKWSDTFFKRQTVYRDCDAEYIEVVWSDVVNYEGYGTPPTATLFMKKLDPWMWYGSDRLRNAHDRAPKDIFRLLVRRDNEVKDHKLGNAWHDAYGWVIGKEDTWDDLLDSDEEDFGLSDYSDGDVDEDEHEDGNKDSYSDED